MHQKNQSIDVSALKSEDQNRRGECKMPSIRKPLPPATIQTELCGYQMSSQLSAKPGDMQYVLAKSDRRNSRLYEGNHKPFAASNIR